MAAIDHREIFERAEVGIALNDPESGTVGVVNERYATLLGYGRDELQDTPIEEISADDPAFDQDAAMAKIRRARDGDRQQFDWLFERRDGSRFWGEVVLKVTEIGRRDRLLAFVRDVSDRKRYERELEQKNRRLDNFTSIVAHDLRNPLTLAKGHLEMAREDCDTDDLDAVARAHGRMEALIDDLLTLAREGDTVEESEPIALAGVVESCFRTMEADAAALVVDAEATIDANRRRLEQLLKNLMHNSVEHAGEGVTITVELLPDGFAVEDDGLGIPESERDRVFDAGYSTADTGTGFGLPIVDEMARAHDWEIQVTEGTEGGARFEITGVTFVE
jgi:PAS domain S-box-containing protein